MCLHLIYSIVLEDAKHFSLGCSQFEEVQWGSEKQSLIFHFVPISSPCSVIMTYCRSLLDITVFKILEYPLWF